MLIVYCLTVAIYTFLMYRLHSIPTPNQDDIIDIEPKNENGSAKSAVNPPSLSETWSEIEKVLATGKVKVLCLR